VKITCRGRGTKNVFDFRKQLWWFDWLHLRGLTFEVTGPRRRAA
jgi:hypothetical protein